MLVSDAAREAAFVFGYTKGTPYLILSDLGVEMDRRKTLWEAGAVAGSRLDLVLVAEF